VEKEKNPIFKNRQKDLNRDFSRKDITSINRYMKRYATSLIEGK
jgi:hypothetical protein